MMMSLTNLDPQTRKHMRAEVEADIAAGQLYLSDRLTPHGASIYPDLLLAAVDSGDTATFAATLAQPGVLKEMEISHRKGVPHSKRVPVNAPDVLAEGEFNRFYARGLCRRAIGDEVKAVRVYRAKPVSTPRSESVQLIGTLLDPAVLLTDLRTSIGMDTALRLPPGPNSGLSVELVS